MNNTTLDAQLKDMGMRFIRTYDFLNVYLDNALDIQLMSLLIDYDSYHSNDKLYERYNGYFECTTPYIQNRILQKRKKIEDSLRRLTEHKLIAINNDSFKRMIKINKNLILLIADVYNKFLAENYGEITPSETPTIRFKIEHTMFENEPSMFEIEPTMFNFDTQLYYNYTNNNTITNICVPPDQDDWVDTIDIDEDKDILKIFESKFTHNSTSL